MFGFNIVVEVAALVALIIIGWLWCKEVFGRFRQDLDQFRSSKIISLRVFILIIWLITICILAFAALFAWSITIYLVDKI